jgi:hypothetical protein
MVMKKLLPTKKPSWNYIVLALLMTFLVSITLIYNYFITPQVFANHKYDCLVVTSGLRHKAIIILTDKNGVPIANEQVCILTDSGGHYGTTDSKGVAVIDPGEVGPVRGAIVAQSTIQFWPYLMNSLRNYNVENGLTLIIQEK